MNEFEGEMDQMILGNTQSSLQSVETTMLEINLESLLNDSSWKAHETGILSQTAAF